jgi:hypothetical protein
MLTPAGTPEAESVSGEVNPAVAVECSVRVAEPARATFTLAALVDNETLPTFNVIETVGAGEMPVAVPVTTIV